MLSYLVHGPQDTEQLEPGTASYQHQPLLISTASVCVCKIRNQLGSRSSLSPSCCPIHLPLYIGASLKEMGLMYSDDLIFV